MTTISPRFEAVSGDFDLATGKLKCVGSRKYAEVDLCFVSDGKWYVPFAKIKLHSSSDRRSRPGAVPSEGVREEMDSTSRRERR